VDLQPDAKRLVDRLLEGADEHLAMEVDGHSGLLMEK
jgi:hypothetical protein